MRLREILLAETKSLLTRGVVDRRPIDGLKGGNGYSSIAQDLGALVEVLRDHRDDVSAKVLVLVDEAAEAGEAIHAAIVQRGEQDTTLSAVVQERQRAFTLLFRAYDEARRAASFLRWREGDVDTLVPSLYAGRGRSRAERDSEPPAEPIAPAEAAPAAGVGLPGASPFIDA